MLSFIHLLIGFLFPRDENRLTPYWSVASSLPRQTDPSHSPQWVSITHPTHRLIGSFSHSLYSYSISLFVLSSLFLSTIPVCLLIFFSSSLLHATLPFPPPLIRSTLRLTMHKFVRADVSLAYSSPPSSRFLLFSSPLRPSFLLTFVFALELVRSAHHSHIDLSPFAPSLHPYLWELFEWITSSHSASDSVCRMESRLDAAFHSYFAIAPDDASFSLTSLRVLHFKIVLFSKFKI